MSLRVTVVHERLTELGGSERVVEQLAAIWPSCRLFTPVADPAVTVDGLSDTLLATSGLQRLYRSGGHYSHLLPLLPIAMAAAQFDDSDLVVTSHHAFANRVRPPAGVQVISYTHTPARWMWEPSMRAGEAGPVGELALAAFAGTQRHADRAAAHRPAVVAVNSRAVAERVRGWWGRSCVVVPPPVDVDWYVPEPGIAREDFFLLAGRLVPYKRPDVAVAAAVRAGVPLVVAGDGRYRRAAKARAGPGVQFLGRVDDACLRDLYRRCRAVVFPGVEDFGIVPVEAQACGTPVIALGVGGALDTVIPGVTGMLVPPSDRPVDDLAAALQAFRDTDYCPEKIREHAERFSRARFRERMGALAEDAVSARSYR